jgi:hypothetical protein
MNTNEQFAYAASIKEETLGWLLDCLEAINRNQVHAANDNLSDEVQTYRDKRFLLKLEILNRHSALNAQLAAVRKAVAA